MHIGLETSQGGTVYLLRATQAGRQVGHPIHVNGRLATSLAEASVRLAHLIGDTDFLVPTSPATALHELSAWTVYHRAEGLGS